MVVLYYLDAEGKHIPNRNQHAAVARQHAVASVGTHLR